MLRRVHEKLGTAGFVISIIALVAALGGGAYAASGGLTGKQKKEVEKIAKKYAGKPGANGTNGTNGAPGSPGAKGDTGGAGGAGAAGKSVTVTAIPSGGLKCEGRAGAEVKQEGAAGAGTPVCEGSPWTDGGTLPEGATETGTWSFAATASSFFEPNAFTAISFPIPLADPGAANKGFVLSKEQVDEEEGPGFDAGCTGTVAEPTAPEGILCVYTGFELLEHAEAGEFMVTKSLPGTAIANLNTFGTTGALLAGLSISGSEPEASAVLSGSWAVTAPTVP